MNFFAPFFAFFLTSNPVQSGHLADLRVSVGCISYANATGGNCQNNISLHTDFFVDSFIGFGFNLRKEENLLDFNRGYFVGVYGTITPIRHNDVKMRIDAGAEFGIPSDSYATASYRYDVVERLVGQSSRSILQTAKLPFWNRYSAVNRVLAWHPFTAVRVQKRLFGSLFIEGGCRLSVASIAVRKSEFSQSSGRFEVIQDTRRKSLLPFIFVSIGISL